MQPYMNKDEIKQTFVDNDLHVTQAVKILLKQAALYTERIHVFKQSGEKLFADKIKACDEQRAKYIYKAIEVASEEKQQHWRFLEDQHYYKSQLVDKYGDLDFINSLKDLKRLVLIYELQEMENNQNKKRALERVS
ncbi:hypothetical protein YK48G_04260 [Lentilactobacillus fungorum]|uniref:Phage protein n=1 Tax=Lentilactobacillus fungorum TaxID=2201250 RepID=A0ABQ3VYC8_9LACO|nr:hypothetical protein [Lentilactobacillus fungorum]GHP13001.1 hypothetical protein YK48G_04260 [Lentilactobacillus fungorum]